MVVVVVVDDEYLRDRTVVDLVLDRLVFDIGHVGV